MTPKEYLEKPMMIRKKLKSLKFELKRYELMMNSIPQPSYGTVRVDKSPSNETPNQKGLEKYYETLDKIKKCEQELFETIDEVDNTIEKLDDDFCKLVLKYKYIDHLTMADIASKLYVSIRTIHRWHNQALNNLKI